MNQNHDYAALEQEYITGTMSLRALCRAHGIENNSSTVNTRKRMGHWDDKRAKLQELRTEAYIDGAADKLAARALREMQVRDNIVEAIDEAVWHMRDDLKRTKLVERPDGSMESVPVLTIGPGDLARLIDRLNVLFNRPSAITEERTVGLQFSADVGLDQLARVLAATSGAQPVPVGGTALPRIEETVPD